MTNLRHLAVGLTVLAIGGAGCGNDADNEAPAGRTEVSVTDLSSGLPAAGDLGLDERHEAEWSEATDLLQLGLVIPAATKLSELGSAIEDAGFQGAVSRDLEGHGVHVRISAAQFDSEAGAREARDLLHTEDLKQPCAEACMVSPREYDLDGVPDSAAVHHVPIKGDLPPGLSRVEAHHAEFVIGAQLYVIQVDGRPSSDFSADFDKLLRTVYESASS